jgi:GNAT superfamily N-acetyltransferase
MIDRVGEVRLATRADVPRLRSALARAFCDDPLFAWMFPREATRQWHLRRYFAHRVKILLAQEQVYTTDGAGAAAMWARPNEWRDPPGAALRELVALTPALGLRLRRSVRAMAEVERRHPRTPHWYLAVLGTEPDRQGRGIGSALLAPVLAACDRDRVPAYLETARERNVDFYGRRGFSVVDSLTLSGGPPVWLMWREPQ